jgi:hypothetical protein
MKSRAPLLFRRLTVFATLLLSLTSIVTLGPPVRADDPKAITAEQVAETVIAIAGQGMGRAVLNQIRRNGDEHGRSTRIGADGRSEDARYELRFVRGDKSEKDKIRLDNKTAQAEFSLVYGEGQIFGIINSNIKEGITFFVVLLVLAIRPTGLLGRRDITKV